MSNWRRPGVSGVISWLVVSALGAVEGMYGRNSYRGDWISYLNVSRAISAHDWKGTFDPMWNPGYPALVALMRGAFPHTPEGEWYAITLLNWLIFLMAFGSWRYLIRQALEFYQPSLAGLRSHLTVVWPTTCAFLSGALCLNNASSVCPDLLVTALFLLAAAQLFSLLNRPGAIRAIGLGMTLGAGCWMKAVCFTFANIFLLVLLVANYSKKLSWRAWALSGLVYLAVFAPYVTCTSLIHGRHSVGGSGALNYAFHVNHMPHWTNWQGGPAIFGTLLHPTRQLATDLPLFEFGAPFRTTYPPYNNMAYWYEGSRNFFSPKLQIIAIGRTFYFLGHIVREHPFLWALALSLFVVVMKRDWRTALNPIARSFWPLFLPAILGIGTYLVVHIEERYTAPFFLIFSLLPLLPLLEPALKLKRLLIAFLLVTFTAGAATELTLINGRAWRAAIRRDDFHLDSQWKLSAALPRYGLKNGDAVAIVNTKMPAYLCHWAYVSNLRIVAEFGSLPWTLAPWDRTRFDHIGSEPADEDYGFVFWKKLAPERRVEVIEAFRRTGARAVLALSGEGAASEPGWQQISGTNAWIYRFTPSPAPAVH